MGERYLLRHQANPFVLNAPNTRDEKISDSDSDDFDPIRPEISGDSKLNSKLLAGALIKVQVDSRIRR